jgi:hypothetical protein
MALTTEQQEWLQKLNVKATVQKELDEREDAKRTMLVQIFRDRERQQGEIRGGTNQTVIKKGTGKTQKTFGVTQTKEFDLDEQRKGYVLASLVDGELAEETWNAKTGEQKQFQKIQKAGRIVSSLAYELQEREVDALDKDGNYEMVYEKGALVRKKVPLFSDAEIREELYTPLVRSRTLPETNVPDNFSDTKQMLDGSFEAYAKRLSREKKKNFFDENKGLIFAGFRGALTVTGDVQGLVAASNLPNSQLQYTKDVTEHLHGIRQAFGLDQNDAGAKEEWATLPDKVAQSFVYVQNVSDIAFDIGYEGAEGIKDRVGQYKTDKQDREFQKAAGKVGGLGIAEIATAIGGPFNSYGLGMEASTTFGALVDEAKIAKLLKENKGESIREAGDLLWEAFEKTIEKLDGTDGNTRELNSAVAAAKTEFRKAFKPDQILQHLANKKYELAVAEFKKAGAAGAAKIGVDALRKIYEDGNGHVHQTNVDTAQLNASKTVCEAFEKDDKSKPTKKQIAEHPKDHKPDWLETGEGFQCLKCINADDDPELFAGIIERKIKQLERDQAILKWASTIGGMAFDVASNFVAPLAIGGALLRMAKNANEAIKRWRDFNAFLERRATMIRAVSAFSSPAAQFIKNAELQWGHYSINAAMEGMKVVAACLQLGLVTAPIGVGLQGGTVGAQAIEGIVYEAKKRWDLGTAWDTYKEALENLESRKLGLLALKDNPTLAKYAMAWGAIIKKDPLVKDFMHSCQLNEDALKDPEANVDLVVSYLEKRMPDDNVVVGRKVSDVGTVELTVKAWVKAKTVAENKWKVEEQTEVSNQIQASLQEWATEFPLQQAEKSRTAEGLKRCIDILNDIDIGLLKYKILDDKEEPVQEMANVKQRFMRETKAQREQLQQWLKELEEK